MCCVSNPRGVLQWYGQKTPWCFFDFREMAFKVLGGDLAKRPLGVGVMGDTKESFGQIIPLE